jgi:type I restriction enzyme S subunit
MERYEKYKDSGIEWIGEIPEHWEVNRIRQIAEIFGRIGYRGYKTSDLVPEGSGAITISPSNMKEFHMEFEECTFLSWAKYEESPEIQVFKGDLLFVKTGSTYGKCSIVPELPEKATINPQIIVFKNILCDNVYLWYSLKSNITDFQVQTTVVGGTIPTISQEKIKNYFIALPQSKNEQTNIATFLDRKTTEIDFIIANKQKLIALYQEEKQAIINQAVTKGLDPNVTLKDSGVSFFGMIPEHWKVKKIKYLLKKNRGALKTGPFGSHLKNSDLTINGQFKVYTQRNVLDNDYKSGEDRINENKFEDLKEFKIEPFDILFTSRGTIGKCSVFPEGCEIGILHPCLIRIQIDTEKVISKWIINYVNGSTHFIDNVKYESNSTIIDVIYGGTLKEIFIPLPSISEQIEINEFIQNESKRLDEIIEKFNNQIDLLKEYRTTLISEVVTGKIKVPNTIEA